MAVIEFDIAAFRAAYPQFANTATFTDATLQGYWDAAICYISDENYGYISGAKRERCLWLMTAHLAALSIIIASGQTPGMVNQATIDKITVTLQPPPIKTQFQWWLGLTPYGQQLLALLQANSVGGMYIGGAPEISAFRKVNGCF